MIVRIADSRDPRIADYLDVRERDLVGRQGRFLAEGAVVIEKLIAAGRHPLLSLLVAESRLEALAERLGGLPPEVPVYVAPQAVMDAVVGFPMHRGLLALGERREPAASDLLAALPARALVVGLSAIANHDNMGGLFRNAAAFGADAVILDAACCDPLYRKAIRVSVGAALTTPFAMLPPGADLAGVLAGAGFDLLALSPMGETPLEDVGPAPRQAALFGAEGPGLAADILARANAVRIPMAGGFDSLNVATASGVVLHHLARLRNRLA